MRISSTNRIATKEELSRLFQEAGLVHFDLSPVNSTSIQDLDQIKLQEYWTSYYDIPFEDLGETEKLNILLNSDIVA